MMHSLPGTDCLALKQLIQRSCLSLIVRSAAEAERFYTAPYLEIWRATRRSASRSSTSGVVSWPHASSCW